MKSVIIPGMLLLQLHTVYGQIGLHNTGVLHVSSVSDTLYVEGNLTNIYSAGFLNNGQFYLRGNLSHAQPSMSAGTGTICLNGTGLQIIAGSETFRTHHLITNNSVGITLNNNLSVSGAHTFTGGIITTSSTPNYLIYESGASYSGDADSKHVNGWVKKIGNTDFAFPVGNGSIERKVSLVNQSASGEFNVKYAQTAPDLSDMADPLKTINGNEYWIISKVSGGSASVFMNWDNSKIAFPNFLVPDISVASYDGNAWNDAGGTASGNASTTGTITSNAVPSFNYFAFASKSFPLPLKIISFTAKRKNEITELAWTTTNEENVSHFEIQRSHDAITFHTIGRVTARNSPTLENYYSSDNTPLQNTAYYRLMAVDKDHRTKYSRVVTITTISPEKELKLVTNPISGKIILSAGNKVNGLFHYRITATNGQLIIEGDLNIQQRGLHSISLPEGIVPGIYLLHLNYKQTTFIYKLIIK